MQYYVAAAVAESGDGTKQSPFKTIQEAEIGRAHV